MDWHMQLNISVKIIQTDIWYNQVLFWNNSFNIIGIRFHDSFSTYSCEIEKPLQNVPVYMGFTCNAIEILNMLSTRWVPDKIALRATARSSGTHLTLTSQQAIAPPYTVGCRYNAVQYDMILLTSLQLPMQNINQIWTHQRHPIPRPNGRAMGCLLWGFSRNWWRYNGTASYVQQGPSMWVSHGRLSMTMRMTMTIVTAIATMTTATATTQILIKVIIMMIIIMIMMMIPMMKMMMIA